MSILKKNRPIKAQRGSGIFGEFLEKIAKRGNDILGDITTAAEKAAGRTDTGGGGRVVQMEPTTASAPRRPATGRMIYMGGRQPDNALKRHKTEPVPREGNPTFEFPRINPETPIPGKPKYEPGKAPAYDEAQLKQDYESYDPIAWAYDENTRRLAEMSKNKREEHLPQKIKDYMFYREEGLLPEDALVEKGSYLPDNPSYHFKPFKARTAGDRDIDAFVRPLPGQRPGDRAISLNTMVEGEYGPESRAMDFTSRDDIPGTFAGEMYWPEQTTAGKVFNWMYNHMRKGEGLLDRGNLSSDSWGGMTQNLLNQKRFKPEPMGFIDANDLGQTRDWPNTNTNAAFYPTEGGAKGTTEGINKYLLEEVYPVAFPGRDLSEHTAQPYEGHFGQYGMSLPNFRLEKKKNGGKLIPKNKK